MKLFQCTIVSQNSCYVQTLLVVAEDKIEADKLIKENQKTFHNLKYTQPLKEITINMDIPNVINYVGWGHNDNDCGFDD